MKPAIILFCLLVTASGLCAQQSKTVPLPMPLYINMLDSTTSIDIVMMLGQGGSLSVQGKNVHLFNSFIERESAPKTNAPLAGTIMWEIHGREYLSGNFYLGDTTGYVIITKEGKEYVNRINDQGNSFFKNQMNR